MKLRTGVGLIVPRGLVSAPKKGAVGYTRVYKLGLNRARSGCHC